MGRVSFAANEFRRKQKWVSPQEQWVSPKGEFRRKNVSFVASEFRRKNNEFRRKKRFFYIYTSNLI